MGENSFPVQYLKGVGPRRAELFAKLGIKTAEDLLRYFPRDWQDRSGSALPSVYKPDGFAAARGKVVDSRFLRTHSGLGIFQADVDCADGLKIEAVWFKRQSFSYDAFSQIKKLAAPGNEIWVVGKTDGSVSGGRLSVRAEECYAADSPEAAAHVGRLAPVYPLTEGLDGKFVRGLVYRALPEHAQRQKEFLPPEILAKRGLMALPESLKNIHFPESEKKLEAARERLAYEEFLLLCSAWEIKKRERKAPDKGFTYKVRKQLLTPFRERLGFEFTQAQKKAINEIFSDMASPRPMTRLLQGDVGSGKTVVALSALLLAAENGLQSAFMAPTEILAEQHYLTFIKFLGKNSARFGLLTSKTKPAEKAKITAALEKGELDIVIGTHSLIEEGVRFKKLALAVIDEQHRFGVRQRALLRKKAENTDLLIMTATPIPRTLALAVYGDLDVSTIDALPPGRLPVKTFSESEEAAFALARKRMAEKKQVYVVHPVIEESDRRELKAVKAEFGRLSKTVFPGFRLGMLHGRMNGKEKTATMEKFLKGELDMLVSTPVIEVGIDVKSAALMIIRNAENFGLASLHQLRGRVGRGAAQSECVLVSSARSQRADERIRIICSTNDGFKIGEKDMEMRGPGELLGYRQHGEMALKAADAVADREILKWALEDKAGILGSDAHLRKPEHQAFRRKLLELYGEKWHLIETA